MALFAPLLASEAADFAPQPLLARAILPSPPRVILRSGCWWRMSCSAQPWSSQRCMDAADMFWRASP
eukprot:4228842-Pyramimonas_sp.AAC.1